VSGVAGALWGPFLAWFGFLRKRPVTMLLTLDKTTGQARLRRSYYFFWRTNTAPLSNFSGVEVSAPLFPSVGGMTNSTSWLRFGKVAWPLLPLYASGISGDGLELAKRVGDWITNQVPAAEAEL
jgi:hypothetical protein